MSDLISANVAKNPTKSLYWFGVWYGVTGQPLATPGMGMDKSETYRRGYRIGQRLSALYNPEA